MDGNIKRPDVDYLFHLSEIAFALELALAKAQEEDSVFRIKSAEDVYHVLTDKKTLEKVLQQGLKDEHKRYKDEIVEFLLNMKNSLCLLAIMNYSFQLAYRILWSLNTTTPLRCYAI